MTYLVGIEVWIEDDYGICGLSICQHCDGHTSLELTKRLIPTPLKHVSQCDYSIGHLPGLTPARVVRRNMKNSEFGLLNSSIAFWRAEFLVLPSLRRRVIMMTSKITRHNYQAKKFVTFTGQKIFNDVESNDKLR